MKKSNLFLICICLLSYAMHQAGAQGVTDTAITESVKIFIVTKNDGTEFVGKILSQDPREVLIETKNLGQIIIPKHEIKEIREVKAGELSVSGEYIPKEIFSTRYFITTNGLPIEKGESYIQWNLYGPDFQFGIRKNFGIGLMTSWVAVPIIGTIKYSIPLGEKVNLGLGGLIGTGSWSFPDLAIALPFGVFTYGDRRGNINFSGGYGAIWSNGGSEGRALFSIAGMTKIGKKVSLIFDSFIVPGISGKTDSGVALLIPGIRLQTKSNRAFQFGFAGIYAQGEFLQFPIPFIQLYAKL
jgi:hypothetical protein